MANTKCYTLIVVLYKDYQAGAIYSMRDDSVPVKADETRSYMEAVAAPETLSWAR